MGFAVGPVDIMTLINHIMLSLISLPPETQSRWPLADSVLIISLVPILSTHVPWQVCTSLVQLVQLASSLLIPTVHLQCQAKRSLKHSSDQGSLTGYLTCKHIML